MTAMDRMWCVGEIVALVGKEGSSNGAGEGILWRVVKVRYGTKRYLYGPKAGERIATLRVEPAWCATGACSLRPKIVEAYKVERVGFIRLAELRNQVDQLCRNALAREAGVQVADDRGRMEP